MVQQRRILVGLLLCLSPEIGLAAPQYVFSKSKPPLLQVFKGDIYSVPNASLQQKVGEATWNAPHSSVPVGGTTNYVNTDQKFTVVHRFYWVLSSVPVRYATDKEFDITETTGFSKTDKSDMEKSLGATAGAKVFGISLTAQASLKLTESETLTWHDEQTLKTHETLKAHYIYDTWNLIDELSSSVETKVSTDPTNKPASGTATITTAVFRDVALIYEDDAPDPAGQLLTGAIASFNSLSMVSFALGAPQASN